MFYRRFTLALVLGTGAISALAVPPGFDDTLVATVGSPTALTYRAVQDVTEGGYVEPFEM